MITTSLFSNHRAALGAGVLGLLLAACPAGGRAEGTDKNATPKASEKEYTLMHKSVYAGSSTQRNPFWPIGWTPSAAPKAVAETVVAAPTVRPEDFTVSSISLDFPALAVINKRTYGVGDRIPVGAAAAGMGTATALAKGADFVTVRQIADGVVVLDHRGTLMRVMTAGSPMAPGKK